MACVVAATPAAGDGFKGEVTERSAGIQGVDWMTGSNVALFGISPHLHVFGAWGGSTGSPAALATSHHDPQRDGSNLQAIEPGVSVRWGEYVRGFATYSAYSDADGELAGEWEEAFGKLVELPGGFELRGGKFLNRFGFQNSKHNHAWSWVNQNLVNGLMLQEGELTTLGGELTWNLPTPFTSALSISGGELPGHDHAREHGEGHGEHLEFEGELANFDNGLITANYMAKVDYNDFHRFSGTLSAAVGENGFGRTGQTYGAGLEYLWSPRGYEPGGSYLRWRNELLLRYIPVEGGAHAHEHEEEPGDEDRSDEFGQFGLMSSLVYGFGGGHWETGARVGYVTKVSELGLGDRFRVSPAVTWHLNRERTLQARLQYDYDTGDTIGSEHSVWFQLGLNWGGPEVR